MTPEQLKVKFKRQGKSFSAWARERGYPLNAVYMVLNGQCKGYYGKGHEIAVALGLKPQPSQADT